MNDSGPSATGPSLSGLTILVVEDEALVSFLVEDMLLELGCTAVLLAGTLSEADAILDRQRPDLAVLDVNLAGELVFPLAARLEQAGVPFLFATGYGAHGLPEHWAARPTVQKPFSIAAFETTLAGALRA